MSGHAASDREIFVRYQMILTALAMSGCLVMSGCLTSPVQRAATAEQGSAADTAAPAFPSEEDLRALLSKRLEANGVGVVVGLIESDGTTAVVAGGRSGAPDDRPLDGDTVFLI